MRRAIAIVLMGLAIGQAQAQDKSPEEALAEAERLEKDGAFRKALAIYQDFIAKNPDHVQTRNVQYRLALCHDSIGELEKAQEILEQVVAGKPDRLFKHRAEAFLRLAKLYGEAKRHADAIRHLNTLLKEGAGAYEDEAQNLLGGYYAMVAEYDEAAIQLNLLRRKTHSPLAKEAAYKLAVVWIEAGKMDLARAAIEDFAQSYPNHPRVVELFIRMARRFFDAGEYPNAVAVSTQIRDQYKTLPEAMEAAFIVALCLREDKKHQKAVEAFAEVARMPQAAHNTILASEALFEAARLYRDVLKRPDESIEFYRQAAYKSRDPISDRQKRILEYSLFYLAEHHFRLEDWSAALDLYVQLRRIGSKLNLLARIMHCQSKLDKSGQASVSADSEEERRFLEQRIASNPGTLFALQTEVYLLDRKLEKATLSKNTGWRALGEVVDGFAVLLKKYPANVLAEQNMRSYIRMRMAAAYAAVPAEEPTANPREKWRAGLDLFEQALAEVPDTLLKVELLEGVAGLAQRLGDRRKAFEAYKTLYEITGKRADEIREANRSLPGDKQQTDPYKYLRGLSSVADTDDMIREAIITLTGIIMNKGPATPEVREAKFYLAELYFMQKRYSYSAVTYEDFVKTYGPPRDAEGNVKPDWVKPEEIDEVMEKVYEAAIRIAHCWWCQGHRHEMLKAYRWVVKNQNCKNPRIAEAHYMLNTHKYKGEMSPEMQTDVAESLWKQVVNPSLDFGSREFARGFRWWIKDPRAVPYVKAAILKAGELYSGLNKHAVAAEVFRSYLEIFSPGDDEKGRRREEPVFPRDEMYNIAGYAVGREYIQAGNMEAMAEFYRPYVDGLRDTPFRPSILTLLGHYGTEAELFNDAREAYAALLDEYGPPNPKDKNDLPIPVLADRRLRPASSWNGLRMAPPEGFDPGKVRYSLGYLYWKQEDWRGCKLAVMPFFEDPSLAKNPYRPQSLFMLGRSCFRMKDDKTGVAVLAALATDYPKFQAADEVHVDLAAGCVRIADWETLDRHYRSFMEAFKASPRRPYIDLYHALRLLAGGQTDEAVARLGSLAKADTYQDLKADAYYHLARHMLSQAPAQQETVFDMLEKSVYHYPRAESLLAAGRAALALGKWSDARRYLDRCVREFPKSEETVLRDARVLLAKVAEEEVRKR